MTSRAESIQPSDEQLFQHVDSLLPEEIAQRPWGQFATSEMGQKTVGKLLQSATDCVQTYPEKPAPGEPIITEFTRISPTDVMRISRQLYLFDDYRESIPTILVPKENYLFVQVAQATRIQLYPNRPTHVASVSLSTSFVYIPDAKTPSIPRKKASMSMSANNDYTWIKQWVPYVYEEIKHVPAAVEFLVNEPASTFQRPQEHKRMLFANDHNTYERGKLTVSYIGLQETLNTATKIYNINLLQTTQFPYILQEIMDLGLREMKAPVLITKPQNAISLEMTDINP
jgi:hypothetical protein